MIGPRNPFFPCIVAALLSGCVSSSPPSDPVRLSPSTYRALLENEYMRLLKIVAKPGERDAMHSHPASAYFVVAGEKLRLVDPEGKGQEIVVAPGRVGFLEPVTEHALENAGGTDLHLVMLELKEKQPMGTRGPDPVQVSPEVYRVLGENAAVRVIEITLKPGQRDKMHGHPSNVVFVLADGAGRLHSPDGSSEDIVFSAGAATFQLPVQHHSLENTGAVDIRAIMFELKPREEPGTRNQ